MEIENTWTPLLISSVRDAIFYHENLLRSETTRDKSDNEEHHLQLTQFFEYLKKEYKKIEGEVRLSLNNILQYESARPTFDLTDFCFAAAPQEPLKQVVESVEKVYF